MFKSRKVKKERKFEEYLQSDDRKGRRLLAKLRSGTNFLRIETGRRKGLNREERVCWFGCNSVENERHFLLECQLYDDIREVVRDKIGEDKIRKHGLEIMLGKTSKGNLQHVLRYIRMAEARRRRTLDLKGC